MCSGSLSYVFSVPPSVSRLPFASSTPPTPLVPARATVPNTFLSVGRPTAAVPPLTVERVGCEGARGGCRGKKRVEAAASSFRRFGPRQSRVPPSSVPTFRGERCACACVCSCSRSPTRCERPVRASVPIECEPCGRCGRRRRVATPARRPTSAVNVVASRSAGATAAQPPTFECEPSVHAALATSLVPRVAASACTPPRPRNWPNWSPTWRRTSSPRKKRQLRRRTTAETRRRASHPSSGAEEGRRRRPRRRRIRDTPANRAYPKQTIAGNGNRDSL